MAALSLSVCLSGQTKVVFCQQWTPQAQFAGYYVAMEKGFFAEEGIDVEIRHPGANSTASTEDLLLQGEADIVGQQLIKSIISKADGHDIVNVFQLTQESGLCCVSHEPLDDFNKLDGKRVGRWKAGFSEICDMLEVYNGIKIEWIPFINSTNLFIFGAVDAQLCYTYSELISLELSTGDVPDENIMKFSEDGYDCPEDGLYVTRKYYETHKDTIEAFCRACKRGWTYARNHQDEALDICDKYIREGHIITNRTHQKLMLQEYLKLQVNPATGLSDCAPVSKDTYDKICDALLKTGYIVSKPEYESLIAR